MSFESNKRVVCIEGGATAGGAKVVLNEMYTVKTSVYFYKGYPVVELFENNGIWCIDRFRPLDEDFATETLARITKQVKEEQLIIIL